MKVTGDVLTVKIGKGLKWSVRKLKNEINSRKMCESE